MTAALLLAFVALIWLYVLLKQPEKPQRRTIIYCPTCRADLIGLNTPYEYEESGLILYVCPSCSTLSRWLFDAPCPILIEHTRQGDSKT